MLYKFALMSFATLVGAVFPPVVALPVALTASLFLPIRLNPEESDITEEELFVEVLRKAAQ